MNELAPETVWRPALVLPCASIPDATALRSDAQIWNSWRHGTIPQKLVNCGVQLLLWTTCTAPWAEFQFWVWGAKPPLPTPASDSASQHKLTAQKPPRGGTDSLSTWKSASVPPRWLAESDAGVGRGGLAPQSESGPGGGLGGHCLLCRVSIFKCWSGTR